jgi:hypothetical protein
VAILKWQRRDLAENEEACSKLFQQVGLHAPHVTIAHTYPEGLHHHVIKRINWPTKTLLDNYSLIVQTWAEGTTIDQAMLQGRVSSENLFSLLEQIGCIVALDLFIGNGDRIVHFDREKKDLHLTVQMNAGNLLIGCDAKTVFPIDNTTTLTPATTQGSISSSVLSSSIEIFDETPPKPKSIIQDVCLSKRLIENLLGKDKSRLSDYIVRSLLNVYIDSKQPFSLLSKEKDVATALFLAQNALITGMDSVLLDPQKRAIMNLWLDQLT